MERFFDWHLSLSGTENSNFGPIIKQKHRTKHFEKFQIFFFKNQLNNNIAVTRGRGIPTKLSKQKYWTKYYSAPKNKLNIFLNKALKLQLVHLLNYCPIYWVVMKNWTGSKICCRTFKNIFAKAEILPHLVTLVLWHIW